MLKCQLKGRSSICKFLLVSMPSRGMAGLLSLFSILSLLSLYPAASFSKTPDLNQDLSSWYGYLYLGNDIGSSTTDKLARVNYKSGGPPEWGIGLGRYVSSQFSLEGTFEYWGERYERKSATVIAGTENNVIQVGGLGLSVSTVYNFVKQNFHAYAGLGAGYFLTGILVTEPGSGLLTDKGAPSDKLLPGYHVSVGVDYRIKGAHKLGIEIKRRFLEADFGQYTDGKVDVGSTYFLVMYRHSVN